MAFMWIVVLVVVLGIAGIGVVAMIVMANNTPTLTKEDTAALAGAPGGSVDVLSATIVDARKGAVVEAEEFGDEYESVNLIIDQYNTIKANDEEWFELVSEYKGRGVAIEWQKKRGGESFFIVKYHQCKSLSDIGLSAGDLEGLSDASKVTFEGQDYSFVSKGEGLFHKGESGFGKEFQFWIFSGPADGWLRIEKRPGDEARVSVARPTSSTGFSVLKVRG